MTIFDIIQYSNKNKNLILELSKEIELYFEDITIDYDFYILDNFQKVLKQINNNYKNNVNIKGLQPLVYLDIHNEYYKKYKNNELQLNDTILFNGEEMPLYNCLIFETVIHIDPLEIKNIALSYLN